MSGVRTSTGRCSVCDVYKKLTASGLIKLHKRHEKRCDGSLQPPRVRTPQPTDEWAAARKATLARDEHRCRKCGFPADLEVHHIKERSAGGTHALDNLITLCTDCHCEWTFCEIPLDFEVWRKLPPARMLLPFFVGDWPVDESADAYREKILNAIAFAMLQRNQRGKT